MKSFHLLGALALVAPFGLSAQNLCPNPSVENGASSPASWFLAGSGAWANTGRTGTRSLAINGTPAGLRYWTCSPPVQQGRAYVVRYYITGLTNNSGFVSGGLSTAKKDFSTRPPTIWADYSYVAFVPSNGVPAMRLEVWYGNGLVSYDDVEILPLDAVPRQVGPYQLGAGESLHAGRYIFNTQFESYGANYSRALVQANADFNTSRWYMDPPKRIVYRHELGGQSFSNAQVTCGILNYNNITSTSLWVEASTDAVNWQFVGGLKGANFATWTLPPSLLPAPEVFVRLSSAASVQFALTYYMFAADVPDTTNSGVGDTHYFGQWLTNAAVRIASVTTPPEGKTVSVQIVNPATNAQSFELRCQTRYADNVRERSASVNIPAGQTNQVSLVLPTAGFGDNTALLTVRDSLGTNLFQENLTFNVSIIADDSYGELLPSPANAPVWWCEGPYKVGQTRSVPMVTNSHARISVARNEYEPFQVVLRPQQTLSNVTASIGDFELLANPSVKIAATNLTICLVDYVPVNQLIVREAYSVTGLHPDPLIPLTTPFTAPAQTNSPLWFTLYVPKEAAAGLYSNTVTLSWDGGAASVPIHLRVYDFALTDVNHTTNAYNVYLWNDWHGLASATTEQKAQVWELYLQNMARHRASPYFPQFFSPLLYTFNSGTSNFTYNFSGFNAAMERYLEEYHFNTFKDVLIERELPSIPGVARFTPATNAINPAYRSLYPKLMQPIIQHFRERGWFDKAYTLWIDEPEDWKIPMVQDGMNMVEETAPDTTRMLTKQVGPSAVFHGNLWATLWDGLNLASASALKAQGDRIWFYMTSQPLAPWPNSFVDYPAICPRVRPWYLDKLGFDGEIYWAINYYSATNPWLNTMCLIPGAYPALLGNGDGVYVYPPTKTYSPAPLIAGPYDSVRWEMNREGMEDREYFWTLKRALGVASASLGTNHPTVIEGNAAYAEAMQLAVWPTAYPYEPARVLQVRDRIAQAIEALDDGSPYLAKQPLSKVVKVGDSERLRVEVVGWPLPTIQWQHEGTNIPGALGAKLSLTNIASDMEGDYRVIAFNSSGSVTSSVGRLTVLVTNRLPVIIKHPDSLVRTNGARAVFGSGVSSLTPVTYQWLFNDTPLGGATNVTVLLAGLNVTNAGLYAFIASNPHGAVTSAPALLSISSTNGSLPPQITSPPAGQSLVSGQSAQFSVTATGSAPLSYQWSVNWTNVTPGGTSNVLTLPNVQSSQAGDYRVIVANSVGVVTSAVATLSVQDLPPFIGTQPTSLIMLQGQSAQFNATAGGSLPLAYQWFFNTSNSLSGANSGVLTLTNIQPSQAGVYSLLVTNSFGAVTSAPAVLEIAGMPNYTTEPPGIAALEQGATFGLSLAPDNRNREILASTDLVNWQWFYSATPSAAQIFVPVPTTNAPSRFFRMRVVP